eukprot:7263950-Karenia_brevis.AAC.1
MAILCRQRFGRGSKSAITCLPQRQTCDKGIDPVTEWAQCRQSALGPANFFSVHNPKLRTEGPTASPVALATAPGDGHMPLWTRERSTWRPHRRVLYLWCPQAEKQASRESCSKGV